MKPCVGTLLTVAPDSYLSPQVPVIENTEQYTLETLVNNTLSYLPFMNYTFLHVDNCSQQVYISLCV